MKLYKPIASVLGIGYIKGGGTIAAIFYCCIWLQLPAAFLITAWQLVTTFLIIAAGVWSSNVADSVWGTDSSKVVIDEIAGMAITLLYAPHQFTYMITGLIAFRFFDIVKPLGIKNLEKLPKGWGVMADDILAGIYAFTIVQLSIHFKIFLK